LAAGLRARGIGPGDPVAFQLPNWQEAAIAFWGISLLGAVVVPIVHSYGAKEVRYILERTGVKAFVTGTSFGLIDFLATVEHVRDAPGLDLVAVVGLDEARDGLVPFTDLL